LGNVTNLQHSSLENMYNPEVEKASKPAFIQTATNSKETGL
jgi:hypothetical protein